ncbi:MAG: hypothetical protein HY657_01010 [Acidobacteria bacterium]|nr:hypothetical protein [Acidobacteriota bacterium]
MRRVVAVLLTVLFVASAATEALAHCVGWSSSIEARHACCDGGALMPEAAATECCAMSEQSNGRVPPEARVAAAPMPILRHASPSWLAPVTVPVDWRTMRVARRPHPVPLYLQQLSLLI